MKGKWNKGMAGLAAAALALTVSVSADNAIAYFTVWASASGSHELELDFTKTMPEGTVTDWVKTITVKNTGDKPCYVRATAFAGSQYGLTWDLADSGGWFAKADGYYYWHEALKPGASTDAVKVKIDHAKATGDFNVIVAQECTPASYDEEGNLHSWDQADWSRMADVVRTESVQKAGGNRE